MSEVTWKKLRLAGFGAYKEPVTVEFQEGLNVLVAPNERGKTTLIAGLQAILFGLPASSDPGKFGDSRFRNWDGAAAFEGELEFCSRGVVYKLKRLFADNRFYLQMKENGRWREELSGMHNPSARRPNLEYEGKLRHLIGLSSRDLFSATFCLNQPLPETEQLDEEVQSLLSGSGGHYRAALEKLQEEAKKLTRYTGSLGITDRDGRLDGALELLKGRLEELRQAWEESREGADNLQKLLIRARELEDKIKDLRKEWEEKDSLYRAWNRWRFLQSRYRETVKKQMELGQAREKVREIMTKLEKGQEKLRRDYPELENRPEDLSAELEALIRREEEKARLEKEQKEIERELEELAAEIASLTARLQEEFFPFQTNPRLLADFQEFQRLSLAKKELTDKLDAVSREEKEIEEQLLQMPDWMILGHNPAALLGMWRQAQPEPGEKWRQFQLWQKELQLIQEKISGPFGLFAQLGAEEEEAISSYTSRKLELEMDCREKKLAREKAEELLAAYRGMEEQFQNEYGDLAGLKEEDIERKLSLLEERRRRQRETDPAPRIFLLPLLLAGIGGCLLAGFGWTLGRNLLYSVLAALLGGIAGWVLGSFLSRAKKDGAPETGIDLLEKELAEIDARLGSRAGAGEAELGVLQHRFSLRANQENKLKEMAQELPSPEELEKLKRQAEEAEKALENFHALTQPFTEVFGAAVSQAYEEYRELIAQKNRLQENLERLSREEYGLAAAELEKAPAVNLKSSWETPRRLWRLLGEEGKSVEDLMGWLEKKEETWWEEITASAAAWEDCQSRLAALQAKKAELEERDGADLTPLERIEEQLSRLEAAISPFDANTNPEYLRELEEAYQEARENLLRLQHAGERLANKKKKLKEELEELAAALEEKRLGLKEYLEPAGGEAATALQRLQSYEEKRQELIGIQGALQALLDGLQVENQEELALKLLDTENEARHIWHQLEELTREHPGLPDHRGAFAPAELENEFRSLAQAREKLAREREDREEELRRVLKEQARLEGMQPLNLAAAELEIKELEEEKNSLELESRALALAYRELEAAVDEYHLSYREHLNREVTAYFRRFTGNQSRRVEIGEDFLIKIVHGGKKCLVSQLSQGARDQLYLSLRLAIASLLSGEINLPLIFDDPFHNFDARRLARVGETLQEIARERQIIFLSHREDFLPWGAPVHLRIGKVL